MRMDIMGKANEDEIVLMGQQQQQQNGLIRTIPIQINSHLIFIDDDIGDPSTYRDVIHCLATCNENDSVNFLINSNGGRTDSIWQIIEATPQLVLSDEIRADALPTATYAGQIELLETSPSSHEHQLRYVRSATNHHHRWDTPSQPEHPSVPFHHEEIV